MNRIPKTSSINSLAKTDRKSSRTLKKKTPPLPKKADSIDLAKLEAEIRILIKNKQPPAVQLRETVVKEIIKWQFGEAAIGNPKFIRAFDKMSTTIENSPIYKEIFDKFMKK